MAPDVKKGQAGQVLLVVILIVIVVSTIGLSIASRSIINLRTSTEQEESQRALAAAEAGIERALQNASIGDSFSADLSNTSSYNSNVTGVNGSEISLNGGNVVPKNEGIDIWFQQHDSSGNLVANSFVDPSSLNLYWGSTSEGSCSDTSNPPAAIQVIAVTNTSGVIKTHRYAYDACNSRGNNFTQADTGSYSVGGVTFTTKTPSNNLASDISGSEKVVFMRVIPLYSNTIVGAENNNAFFTQGLKITSTGESLSSSRKLVVFKSYPQTYLPYISYGLFVAN